MGNHALDVNPPNASISITRGGSDWLWAVFTLMALADLIVIAWTFTRPRGTRAFHYLAIAILTITAIDYFSQASDLGSAPVTTEFRQPGTRAIWFTRYIDWILTGPMLLAVLLLSSAVALSEIFIAMFAAIVFWVCFLIGALVPSTYKWGYFTFGVAALLFMWYLTARPFTFSAGFLGRNHGTGFRGHSHGLLFIWSLYPIAWGLSEGGNVISPTKEMIFYGILDLFAKPIFLLAYLRQVGLIDYGSWGFHSGKASQFGAAGAPVMGTKGGFATGTTGAGPGAVNTGTGVDTAPRTSAAHTASTAV